MFKTVVSVFSPKSSLELSRDELKRLVKSFKLANILSLDGVVPIIEVAKPQNLVTVTFATADETISYSKLKKIATKFEQESINCSELKYT